MTVDEFHRHWREVHAQKILDNDAARRYLVRYEQNHRTTQDYERTDDMHGDFDGVAIQWFRSVEDFYAMVSDPGYQAEVGPDEAVLLDTSATKFVLTEAEETILGP